ncbi:hypothetical protein H4219_005492 [Mycoemilia scoparia]|uniref:Uncharacterized protein n=1 Tax=Mycoemilia scoparia TaxID=417184 RepID=A0A9W8DPZ4_9FUNG|nr:hypothetical protein H4219_005492 [Mycoemilia scoparia]
MTIFAGNYKKVKTAVLKKTTVVGKHSDTYHDEISHDDDGVDKHDKVTESTSASSGIVSQAAGVDCDYSLENESDGETGLRKMKHLSIDTVAFGTHHHQQQLWERDSFDSPIEISEELRGGDCNESEIMYDDISDILDIGYIDRSSVFNTIDNKNGRETAKYCRPKRQFAHPSIEADSNGLLKSTSVKEADFLSLLMNTRRNILRISGKLICTIPTTDSIQRYIDIFMEIDDCCHDFMSAIVEGANQFARYYQSNAGAAYSGGTSSEFRKVTFDYFLVFPVIVSMDIGYLKSVLPADVIQPLKAKFQALKELVMLSTFIVSAIIDGNNMWDKCNSKTAYVSAPLLLGIYDHVEMVLSLSDYLSKETALQSNNGLGLDLLVNRFDPDSLFVKTADTQSFVKCNYCLHDLPDIPSMLKKSPKKIMSDFSLLLNSNFGIAFIAGIDKYYEGNEFSDSKGSRMQRQFVHHCSFQDEPTSKHFNLSGNKKGSQAFSLSQLFE